MAERKNERLLPFLDELWTHAVSKQTNSGVDSADTKQLESLGTEFKWTPTNIKTDIGTGGNGEFEWRIPADGYIEIDRDGKQFK